MDVETLNAELQGMDMSLLDQLLKGRFMPGSKVLDAGFGNGRNSFWFIDNGFDVFGVDKSEAAYDLLKERLAGSPQVLDQFYVGDLVQLSFANSSFDLVICNAVLHFARDLSHFKRMFGELVRVLNQNGILFIRMTSDIGISDKIKESSAGVYLLPDGSMRFLLTLEILHQLIDEFQLSFIEPLKTVNVNDLRAMSTLVLCKKESTFA